MSSVGRVEIAQSAVSIQDAAVALCVSEITIRRHIRNGKLRAIRIGPKLIRIPRRELARYAALYRR